MNVDSVGLSGLGFTSGYLERSRSSTMTELTTPVPVSCPEAKVQGVEVSKKLKKAELLELLKGRSGPDLGLTGPGAGQKVFLDRANVEEYSKEQLVDVEGPGAWVLRIKIRVPLLSTDPGEWTVWRGQSQGAWGSVNFIPPLTEGSHPHCVIEPLEQVG